MLAGRTLLEQAEDAVPRRAQRLGGGVHLGGGREAARARLAREVDLDLRRRVLERLVVL